MQYILYNIEREKFRFSGKETVFFRLDIKDFLNYRLFWAKIINDIFNPISLLC